MGIPTPKTISSRLDLIRDNYNKKLTDEEREALIIAANVIRENPDISQKYINYRYKNED